MSQLERSPSTSQTQANGPQLVRRVTCWFKEESGAQCQKETIFLYSTHSSTYPLLHHTFRFLPQGVRPFSNRRGLCTRHPIWAHWSLTGNGTELARIPHPRQQPSQKHSSALYNKAKMLQGTVEKKIPRLNMCLEHFLQDKRDI